jgi:hypothetical protein
MKQSNFCFQYGFHSQPLAERRKTKGKAERTLQHKQIPSTVSGIFYTAQLPPSASRRLLANLPPATML